MRVVYTLLMLAIVAGFSLLMLKGWRSRQRRQSDLPPPAPAPENRTTPLLPPVPGLFVGTVLDGDWLDRVAVHDLSARGTGWLTVTGDGVHVDRDGLPELYLPRAGITGAATGSALAGKVVAKDGLLLVDWVLGGRRLTSGFRADDHDAHARLVEAITSSLEVSP